MPKRKPGQPTKYKKKYCKEIVKFFSVPSSESVLVKEIIKSNGTVEREYKQIAGVMPKFSSFAKHIGVNEDTVVEWQKATNKVGKLKHPEFSAAYKTAKGLQEAWLLDNGLRGLTPAAAFIFTAKNVTGMRDKQEVDHSTLGEKIPAVVGFTYQAPVEPSNVQDQSNT